MENSINMIHRIAIIGPESSGKSTLAKKLALHFSEPYVNEFARTYLEGKNGKYQKVDLDFMAEQQLLLEDKIVNQVKKFLICDTNPLVIKVWSDYKYGDSSQSVINSVTNSSYSLHLLLYPDLEHESDLLRENPNIVEREEIFSLYEQELLLANENFFIVKGRGDSRFKSALNFINSEFSF